MSLLSSGYQGILVTYPYEWACVASSVVTFDILFHIADIYMASHLYVQATY